MRLAGSAGAALQMALFSALDVVDLCRHGAEGGADDCPQQPWPDQLAHSLGITVNEAVLAWARGLSHLLDMGDEARRLAEQVD